MKSKYVTPQELGFLYHVVDTVEIVLKLMALNGQIGLQNYPSIVY